MTKCDSSVSDSLTPSVRFCFSTTAVKSTLPTRSVTSMPCSSMLGSRSGVWRPNTSPSGSFRSGVVASETVRYLSQFMVLDPGDIINTRTPPGVALGMPDKPYLRAGDVVELGISGLGWQRQRFIPAP